MSLIKVPSHLINIADTVTLITEGQIKIDGGSFIYHDGSGEIELNSVTPGFSLAGRVNDTGTVALTSSTIGASFSVSHPGTGIYDVTLTAIPAGNYRIDVQINQDTGGGGGLFHQPKVTDKNLTTGFGTNTGFSILTFQQIGAGAGARDVFWSFTVVELA